MALDPKVKKKLSAFIEEETRRAVEKKDLEYASKLQEAKRLVERGTAKVRKVNPYIKFMGECLLKQKVKGQDQEATRKAMIDCGGEWNKLSEDEKKRWKLGEFDVYDYS